MDQPSAPRTPQSNANALSPPPSANITKPISSQPITVDALLRAHAADSSPTQAALEHVTADRNTLAAQNSQLWKLIEKQRQGYQQIIKELERVRGERDAYRAKLLAIAPHTSLPRTHHSSDASRAAAKGRVDGTQDLSLRDTITRHHSDDLPTPRGKHHHHAAPDSRPQEFASTAHPAHHSQLSVPNSNDHKPAPPPLSVPVRVESLPFPTSGVSATPENTAQNGLTSSRRSNDTDDLQDEPSPAQTQTQARPPPLVQYSQVPPPPRLTPDGLSNSDSPHPDNNHNTRAPTASPFSATPLLNPHPPELSYQSLSRDSRITLPDEARQYITSMVDSPLPSPQPDSSTHTRSYPSSNLSHIQEIGDNLAGVSPGGASPSIASSNGGHSISDPPSNIGSEFLDMEDDGEDDGEGDVEEDDLPVTDPGSGHNQNHSSMDDFPLPPYGLASNSLHSHSHRQALQQLDTQSIPRGSTSSQASHNIASPLKTHQQQDADRIQNVVPSPNLSFRALPLLAADLPHTQVQVTNSSIRPNDRGKDVLSFIVLVSPGPNKDSWRVEKLYSDVIALDQRMRSHVGRNVLKKIGALPEPKLWKDHAPAKVDQRKTALETYLQSLLRLPIKNKDEIIAFLTSDIVRETKKPVMQMGHKEGYLTKRGKNFGGWKSRYFVLQGPILEYYESRGGAHLGSINVTGAQIGRQQRSADKGAADDEKEYRHAFLIVEAKKGPGGNHARHVLCAESDEDRDSWVDILVRYFSGTYGEDGPIDSVTQAPVVRHPPVRGMSKDDIQIQKGPAVPLSQLPADATHAKFLQTAGYADEPLGSSSVAESSLSHRELVDKESSSTRPRANSSQSHHIDSNGVDHRLGSIDHHREGDPHNERSKSLHQYSERSPSPEKADSKNKISRPMNGAPIPSGFKFGGKEQTSDASPSLSDRREKAKSRSFWGFGRPNDKPSAQQAPLYVPRAVFGVSLEESIDVVQVAGLPAIVFRCIKYLEAKKADQEEGIYRLSGSSAVIKSLRDRFNSEGDVDLLASDEYWDPHAIAGLLKGFLRELPTSILTRDLHLRFLAVIDFVDPQERIKELSHLIAALPIANYTLLRALTAHLILIVQNSSVNKMNMRNVGIVFSPTLGIPAGVFSLMLGEFNRVFNVNNEIDDGASLNSRSDAEVDHLTATERRNSKQYSDTAADQLLGISGRALLATTEEGQSDTDGMSIQDDSGLDTTDGEDIGIESSSASSPTPGSLHDHQLDVPDTPTVASQLKNSKAHTTAANRGLNIAVGGRGNRHSRIMGLPTSPRPPATPEVPGTNTIPSSPSKASLH